MSVKAKKATEEAPTTTTPEAPLALGPARYSDGLSTREFLSLVHGPGEGYARLVSRFHDQSNLEVFCRMPEVTWHAGDLRRPIEDALSWGVPAFADLRRFSGPYATTPTGQAVLGVSLVLVPEVHDARPSAQQASSGRYQTTMPAHYQRVPAAAEREAFERLKSFGCEVVVRAGGTVDGLVRLAEPVPVVVAQRLMRALALKLGGALVAVERDRMAELDHRVRLMVRAPEPVMFMVPRAEAVGRFVPRHEVVALQVSDTKIAAEDLAAALGVDLAGPEAPPAPTVEPRRYLSVAETYAKIFS